MPASDRTHGSVGQLEQLPCRTRCGYCDRELDLQPGGHWQCSACAPQLALIRTEAEWVAFIARSRA